MVAKKLLVDAKIIEATTGNTSALRRLGHVVCIVLNRKTLSGASHFAFLKNVCYQF